MDPALEPALTGGSRPSAVVLVEGVSDQRALEALAERRGRDLAGEGVVVAPIGGASAIGHFLAALGPHGQDLRLAGLCDAGEESLFRRELERAGYRPLTKGHKFLVTGKYGPLKAGELERARAWGAELVAAAQDRARS